MALLKHLLLLGFFFFLMAYQAGRVRENTNFIRKLSFIHFYKTNLIVSVFLLVNRCFKMFITFSWCFFLEMMIPVKDPGITLLLTFQKIVLLSFLAKFAVASLLSIFYPIQDKKKEIEMCALLKNILKKVIMSRCLDLDNFLLEIPFESLSSIWLQKKKSQKNKPVQEENLSKLL